MNYPTRDAAETAIGSMICGVHQIYSAEPCPDAEGWRVVLYNLKSLVPFELEFVKIMPRLAA